MKYKVIITPVLLMALFLAVAGTAVASTTWYVNGVSGSDSDSCTSPTTACKTIGHAISLALSGDSIIIAAATYMENLTIDKSLTILGSGGATTVIDGSGIDRVVYISSATTHVILSKLTIRNGYAPSGGGVYNTGGTLTINNSTLSGNVAEFWGGGIYNSGTLRVIDSTLSGNIVYNYCYNICTAWGGGIYNHGGTLMISNSTLNGNRAFRSCSYCQPGGGGIFNGGGTLRISNSTLSENSAVADCTRSCEGFGGGIWSGGSVTINNSTLSGNSTMGKTSGGGGGIYGTATLQNSIVANSPKGGNCSGTMTSKGYNLSSDSTCNFSGAGDLNNTNPLLGPLQNNGGPTQTMALLPGSSAIDAGNPSGCTDGLGHLLKTDQRGQPRPDKEDTAGCDMGAFESQSD